MKIEEIQELLNRVDNDIDGSIITVRGLIKDLTRNLDNLLHGIARRRLLESAMVREVLKKTTEKS